MHCTCTTLSELSSLYKIPTRSSKVSLTFRDSSSLLSRSPGRWLLTGVGDVLQQSRYPPLLTTNSSWSCWWIVLKKKSLFGSKKYCLSEPLVACIVVLTFLLSIARSYDNLNKRACTTCVRLKVYATSHVHRDVT